jgi:competence protein ComFC
MSLEPWIWQNLVPFCENAINWLFPPRCITCETEGYSFCFDCQSKIQVTLQPACIYCGTALPRRGVCKRCSGKEWNYDEVRQFGLYSGPLAQAIRSLKYEHNLFLGPQLAGFLIKTFRTTNWKPDLVTAVPLSPRHKRSRGYNQAALLARPLASRIGLPYFGNALKRIRETKSQVTLNFYERQANVADAFQSNEVLVRDRNVLLVDDVFTTGATLNECARALKASGANSVYGLTLAKALDKPENNFSS